MRSLTGETFAVVDVETTGLDPRRDAVIEIAIARVCRGEIVERFASFVDPGRSIPAAATAVHGIRARDVRGAPTLAELAPRIARLAADAVVVAHNARFDLGFLPMLATQRALCTLQLARRFVDAPNYQIQTLRAHLRLDVPDAGDAHRALADTLVTVELLRHLLARIDAKRAGVTYSQLRETIERPTVLASLGFGRHRGRPIADVPSGYLRWIVESGFDGWPDVAHSARTELARRGGYRFARNAEAPA